MRHVWQKEGISQGRDTLRVKLAGKDLEIAEVKEKMKAGAAEVAEMRDRVRELEVKNETLEEEKKALVEEKARMLDEGDRMKAEMANLTSRLGRWMIDWI